MLINSETVGSRGDAGYSMNIPIHAFNSRDERKSEIRQLSQVSTTLNDMLKHNALIV